jgi:hypothetical protein
LVQPLFGGAFSCRHQAVFYCPSTTQNTAVTPTTFSLGFLATAASFASL